MEKKPLSISHWYSASERLRRNIASAMGYVGRPRDWASVFMLSPLYVFGNPSQQHHFQLFLVDASGGRPYLRTSKIAVCRQCSVQNCPYRCAKPCLARSGIYCLHREARG